MMNIELPQSVVEYYSTQKGNLEKLISLQEKDSEKYIEKQMELNELNEKFREQQETINSIAMEAQKTSGMTDSQIENLFKRFAKGDITEKELTDEVRRVAQQKDNGHMYR